MIKPTIDTFVARGMYSSSSIFVKAPVRPAPESQSRARSHSVASTASTISLITPVPSSGNPSSSSLELPAIAAVPDRDADQTPSTSAHRIPARQHEQATGSDLDPDPEREPDYFDQEQDQVYSDEDIPVDEYVLALHDFVPQHPTATCLAFRAGDTIRVLSRDPSGWWDGELDGRRGWFPSNYVDTEVRSLIDEELPTAQVLRGHTRIQSDASFASRASTASPRAPSMQSQQERLERDQDRDRDSERGESPFPASPSHTPPLMVPLLQGLHLLQNTVISRTVTHYQPAVATIIQCIRELLQRTGCLERSAPLLRRHPQLAQERKAVLAELALLVSQSKKASSADFLSEEDRGPDEEELLRLAGRVFARVRRFLAVAVQCGVDVPVAERGQSADTTSSETLFEDLVGSGSSSGHKDMYGGARSQYGFNAYDEGYSYPARAIQKSIAEVQYISADDSYRSSYDSTAPLIPSSHGTQAGRRSSNNPSSKYATRHRYHGRQMSFSSSSSFSSFSSQESPNTPPSTRFPEGACSPMQVHQALRLTHDSLLSTIAAFMAHVHAHSRAAHASSTGHLFALVRQIVDIVCKLLTIVDAVMGALPPAVPGSGVGARRVALDGAKELLYQMACVLADAVREMACGGAGSGLPPPEEDEERGQLLKVATDALKAGSDCVYACKACLMRTPGAPLLVVILPPLNTEPAVSTASTTAVSSPAKTDSPHDRVEDMERLQMREREEFVPEKRRVSAASTGTVLPETLDELRQEVKIGYGATTPAEFESDAEDATIQPPPPALVTAQLRLRNPDQSDEEEDVQIVKGARLVRDSRVVKLDKPIVEVDESELPPTELPEPPTDDERSPWQRSRKTSSLEEKLIKGDLPPLPEDAEKDRVQLSHDYALQDVAYNSEAHLVGATLEALVEMMTPHDQTVDAAFQVVFFSTFRLFTTPVELAHVSMARFNLPFPAGLSEADAGRWLQQKRVPVRLRVSNFFRVWLESHWRPGEDEDVLDILQVFARDTIANVFAGQAQRIEDLIASRRAATQSPTSSPVSELHRLRESAAAAMPLSASVHGSGPPSAGAADAAPRVSMTRALLGQLKARNFSAIQVTDFDATELARQLTLMECARYCAVTAEEMLEGGISGGVKDRKGKALAPNVKAVSALSTAVTGWVSESVLGEQDVKRRVVLLKYFIKVADVSPCFSFGSRPGLGLLPLSIKGENDIY